MSKTPAARSAFDRRAFLRTLALGAGTFALGPTLTGCGGSGGASSAATGGAAVPLPDYVPAIRIAPDLPGNADGLQDCFLTAPAQRYRTVEGAVASGGETRALLRTYTPPPPPVGENTWWQAVNERVGTEFRIEVTPTGDYTAKFSSVMAGGDIPDLVQVPLNLKLPRLPDLLSSTFADLSDHLSGSNVRAYPNLAGIPTYSWRHARIRGRIYGVPISRPVFSQPMLLRADLFEQLGLPTQPTSAAEFEQLCAEITDPAAGRWAIGADQGNQFNLDFFLQMYGAPCEWRLEPDGRLTRKYETEEYAEAVEFARRLNAAGYFHPDAASATPTQVNDQLAAGHILMRLDGINGWGQFYDRFPIPGVRIDAMVNFGHSGGPGTYYYGDGVHSLTVIKQADPERVEELLRAVNFFAAPYGSEEHELCTYGVEGVDFERDSTGAPQLTERGDLEGGTNWQYIGVGAPVIEGASRPDWARAQYEWEQQVVPMSLTDPTAGLYSETESRADSEISNLMRDTVIDIVSGRTSISELPAAVDTWRSGGGDQIRQEYQDALAAEGP